MWGFRASGRKAPPAHHSPSFGPAGPGAGDAIGKAERWPHNEPRRSATRAVERPGG